MPYSEKYKFFYFIKSQAPWINVNFGLSMKEGIFVYLEPRRDSDKPSGSFLKAFFLPDSAQSANCFTISLLRSQFAARDRVFIQRVFKDMVYGIIIK